MDEDYRYETNIIASELQRLRNDLETVKSESRRENRPWYTSASVLISAFSLGFAVLTAATSAYVSVERSRAQALNDDRAALRSLIQQLLSLQNLPPTSANANEIYITVAQAKLLVTQIEARNSELITAPEYAAIGSGMAQTRNLAEALDYFAKAISRSDTLGDDLAAKRGMASALIYMQKYDQGAAEYSSILSNAKDSPFVKYNRLSDKALMVASDSQTYGHWANDLFNMNKCTEGQKFLSAAISLQSQLTPPTQRAAMEANLTNMIKLSTPCQ